MCRRISSVPNSLVGGGGGEGGKEVGRCEFCLRAEHFEIRISRMKQSSQSAVVGLRPVPAGSPAPVPRTAGLVPGSPGPFPGLGRVPGGSPRDRFLRSRDTLYAERYRIKCAVVFRACQTLAGAEERGGARGGAPAGLRT
jgi:hypothetical protein